MSESNLHPKLRWPIDIKIEKVEGQEVLLLRCPLGISPAPLLLVAAVAPIVSCFQGNMSVEEITDKFASYGIKKEMIEQLIKILDDNLFLVTPRFLATQTAINEEFEKSTVRQAALAGLSYSNSASELGAEIDRYLNHANGAAKIVAGEMIGLVSPHIDYRRGNQCYGVSYHQLKYETHDLYILMGTAHQYSKHMFHLTTKDFANPLSTLSCDRELVNQLARLYGIERSFADEILHRREHSLELQIPFISRINSNVSIVPILVGSFQHMLAKERSPQEFSEYEQFVSSLVECLAPRIKAGTRVCFVAGVDMAHIGRVFGDEGNLSIDFMKEIERRDKIYLDTIERHDKQALFEHVAADQDARRICGFPTMYTMLDTLERLNLKYKACTFDYRQAVDYETDCAVTFAGLGMYKIQ